MLNIKVYKCKDKSKIHKKRPKKLDVKQYKQKNKKNQILRW